MHSYTVLVTGAGGFIGANLVRKLQAANYRVHIIWKSTTNPLRIKDIKTNLIFHEVDLANLTVLKHTLGKIQPDYIFHLATHGAYSSQTDANLMEKVNVQGTLNLLQATLNIPYKVFVNTGTSSEYGFKNKPMKETDLLTPTSVYAATKAAATLLGQVFARIYNKPIVTLRPFSVYGPFEEPSRFIPTIIRAVLTNTSIRLTAGNIRRDFVYVDDVVNAYLKTMTKGPKLKGEILNIGTGRQYTNDEVVKTFFTVTKKSVFVKKGAFNKRSWDTDCWVADISRAKKILAWKPAYSLAEGLRKTYNWSLRYHALSYGSKK